MQGFVCLPLHCVLCRIRTGSLWAAPIDMLSLTISDPSSLSWNELYSDPVWIEMTLTSCLLSQRHPDPLNLTRININIIHIDNHIYFEILTYEKARSDLFSLIGFNRNLAASHIQIHPDSSSSTQIHPADLNLNYKTSFRIAQWQINSDSLEFSRSSTQMNLIY